MSLAAHLLRQAVDISAKESVRRLDIDGWTADKLSPIALSLFMRGLLRRTKTPVGALLFAAHLNQYTEDLLANQRRLSAPDIRARGQTLTEEILGPYCLRAIEALANLAAIDPRRASELLYMEAAAAMSALSRTQRELQLKTFELRGVLKSEAAQVDNADPKLAGQVSAWVFRPGWFSRFREKTRAAVLQSRGAERERPGFRLKRPSPVKGIAIAPRSGPDLVRADARFRVVGAERRIDQAKAEAIMARALRSGNHAATRPQPYLKLMVKDQADKLAPRLAGVR